MKESFYVQRVLERDLYGSHVSDGGREDAMDRRRIRVEATRGEAKPFTCRKCGQRFRNLVAMRMHASKCVVMEDATDG